MPRKAAWPPKVTPKNGRDRVRVQGDDIYLGPEGSLESKRAYAELLARVARGEPARPPKPGAPAPAATTTVADVVAAWLEQEAPRYSPQGREVAQFRFTFAPLLALYGALPAASFGPDEAEALQLAVATGSWLTGEGRDRRGRRGQGTTCCAAVVNRRMVRVRTLWRWAERKKLVPPGSWAGLRTAPPLAGHDPRVRRRPRRGACAFVDLLAVARAAPRVVGHMLILGWWSGMRPGEVRTLRRCEVDTTGPEWVYRPGQHKNTWRGQDRTVVLGPKARAVLRPWLERAAPDGYVFPPSRKRKGGKGFYSMLTLSKAVRRARLRAGVKGVVFYSGRHSCKQRVTRALGLDFARSVLGQASLDVTNDYGAAVDLDMAKEAARKLG